MRRVCWPPDSPSMSSYFSDCVVNVMGVPPLRSPLQGHPPTLSYQEIQLLSAHNALLPKFRLWGPPCSRLGSRHHQCLLGAQGPDPLGSVGTTKKSTPAPELPAWSKSLPCNCVGVIFSVYSHLFHFLIGISGMSYSLTQNLFPGDASEQNICAGNMQFQGKL